MALEIEQIDKVNVSTHRKKNMNKKREKCYSNTINGWQQQKNVTDEKELEWMEGKPFETISNLEKYEHKKQTVHKRNDTFIFSAIFFFFSSLSFSRCHSIHLTFKSLRFIHIKKNVKQSLSNFMFFVSSQRTFTFLLSYYSLRILRMHLIFIINWISFWYSFILIRSRNK